MTTLIIARHGNTFGPGEVPTRVGKRTNPPLAESGRAQAVKIGRWLKQNNLDPDAIYSSTLLRTIETAAIAAQELGRTGVVSPLSIFDEIDYGPDENKPEAEVVARLGEDALRAWNEEAVVPDGWVADPTGIVRNWKAFARDIVDHSRRCVFVVTSNGIARFAPHITEDFAGFARTHKIKVSTGALCILKYEDGRWGVREWNLIPA